MHPIIILISILISFCSLFITFKAIYLILSKKFKGSKPKWILIVMIAIIGPILWITKGKKLIER
jgi:hypothetical protein